MEESVFNAALAGLLHDIGKFAQRAGQKPTRALDTPDVDAHGPYAALSSDFVARYVPARFQTGLSGALYHHESTDKASNLIHLARRWAVCEPIKGGRERADPRRERLMPILGQVSLQNNAPAATTCHRLVPLKVSDNTAYPVDESSLSADWQAEYAALWQQMCQELDSWKALTGWETQDADAYFTTLLALLRKYLWCVPAATSRQPHQDEYIWPDVSLLDHIRLTSAIAACVTADGRSDKLPASNQPAAFLLRGDVSGIQNFIYRVSQPSAETEHIAKRLRGRSFYLTLWVEVAVDWILRKLGLPPNCALFVGGGRFDLLIPISKVESALACARQIHSWLLASYQGELALLIATCPVKADDFGDMRPVYRSLETELEKIKRHKWSEYLSATDFFLPASSLWHTCRVCQLTPLPEPKICPDCQQHERIGKYLPHAVYLAYDLTGQASGLPDEQIVTFPNSPWPTRLGFVLKGDRPSTLISSGWSLWYKLNDTSNFIHPPAACAFRFLANAAPRASERIYIKDSGVVDEYDVLNFEAIAALSSGAQRIGILKADVDYLGLVMSEGLVDEQSGLRPTIARVAALSSALDVFFSGLLNQICRQVFEEWRDTSAHPFKDAVDGLFYVVYGGGDDLFIVGPWDQVLVLAARLEESFHSYSGSNPNLTLSAGYVQVKPHYPTQKFADLVDEAEKSAKNAGRNCFCAFNQVMKWRDGASSFASLFALADDLRVEIECRKLSRGILADLGQVYRQHLKMGQGQLHPMWTPRLYYSLSRRLTSESFQTIGRRLIEAMSEKNILVPVSITSLITRKE